MLQKPLFSHFFDSHLALGENNKWCQYKLPNKNCTKSINRLIFFSVLFYEMNTPEFIFIF